MPDRSGVQVAREKATVALPIDVTDELAAPAADMEAVFYACPDDPGTGSIDVHRTHAKPSRFGSLPFKPDTNSRLRHETGVSEGARLC